VGVTDEQKASILHGYGFVALCNYIMRGVILIILIAYNKIIIK